MYRAFMTSLFVGVADAFLSLIFNIVYRSGSADFSNDLINVATLIFGMLIVFTLIGIVYGLLVSTFERGNILFIILFSLLTLLGWWAAGSIHYAVDPLKSQGFIGLLRGLIVMVGISAVAGIPFLHQSKKFEEYVA